MLYGGTESKKYRENYLLTALDHQYVRILDFYEDCLNAVRFSETQKQKHIQN